MAERANTEEIIGMPLLIRDTLAPMWQTKCDAAL